MTTEVIFITSLVIIWTFLLYHIFLSYEGFLYYQETEREKQRLDNLYIDMKSLPFVSVLIPAHNEDIVIENTLKAIGSFTYPKERYEILLINDHSTDDTARKAEKLKEKIENLRVLNVPEGEGRSKGAALNYGVKQAKGELIAVYDADNTPEKKALLYLVLNIIKDKTIGAVIGKFRTRNRNRNLLTKFINIETIFFQWTIQAGRGRVFKLTTIPGTNFIIRKDLLRRVGYWDPKALTEDTDISIKIYQQGKWIKMAPYSITWEEEPERFKIWIRQRTRWALGNLQVIFKYLPRFFSLPKKRIYVDILYFFLLYFMFFLAIVGSLYVFITGGLGLTTLNLEGPFILLWVLAIVLFVIEVGITLTAERGENTLENMILTFIMYFTYTQLWTVIMFRVFFQKITSIFLRKRIVWDKTKREG